MSKSLAQRLLSVLAIASIVSACSGSSGGGDGFQLTRISLINGAVWKVNQEIVFTFSDEVDFSSVSLNTINIQTTTGAPATGAFTLRAPNVVVFQPNCPRLGNLSDAGLKAGGIPYAIRVAGQSSGAGNTVRSTGGAPLEVTQVRSFTTDSGQSAFIDTQQGPPVPVVRAQGSAVQSATYLEIGGDPDQRVYFERDPSQNLVLSVPGFLVPLNLYSDTATRVAVVIEFNQALDPAADNISTDQLRLQFFDGSGLWRPLETAVTLVANCTETGARVRLEPIGVLPRASQIRAVVLAGLRDLVAQESQTIDNFAIAPTREVEFTSLTPADELSDEFPESFDFGGSSTLSFEDTGAFFETPAAAWGGGQLTAAFEFEGSGGPSGTFDWLIEDGDTVVFDTDNAAIVGADGLTVQVIDDGVVDLRNWTVEQNAEVRVQGSKPLRVNATGDVIIRGLVDLSGFSAQDVIAPNRGDITEQGGSGGPGGGRGGNANEVNTSSTIRGGSGHGPEGLLNAGGQGGETGFAGATAGKDSRRPGGGAGGRFAVNQGGGLSAQNGADGHANARGAEPSVVGVHRPAGGLLSPGPFVDGSTANNFFGTQAEGTTGDVTGLVRGELPSLWGGYGGGGGGNANPATQFPTPNWSPASDERGGAGGGGGGGIHIRALGKIQFGASGLIRASGGRGATGENVLGQDHVAGSGGSGSGGHVILETASFVDFTDGGVAIGAANRDWISAVGGPAVTGPATTGGNVSQGGSGGPGVIQLHVPASLEPPVDMISSTSDIVVPTAALGPNPINAVTSPEAEVLVPSFAARSFARSEWISLGRAEETPSGVPSLVRFLFQGTQTTAGSEEGKILVTGDEVQELAPLLDEDLEGNPNLTVLADRVTLRVSGASLAPFAIVLPSGLSNDLYLRNPALLEDFVLRLSVGAAAQEYSVASAVYAEGAAGLGDEQLSLTVVDAGVDLQDFITANTALGTIHYQLVPRFFRVTREGVEDALPADAFVRIRFQGAADDGTGAPDAANPLVNWTGDISLFNQLVQGELQFFRFEVEFELANGSTVSSDTRPISLDFLRIPFVF